VKPRGTVQDESVKSYLNQTEIMNSESASAARTIPNEPSTKEKGVGLLLEDSEIEEVGITILLANPEPPDTLPCETGEQG